MLQTEGPASEGPVKAEFRDGVTTLVLNRPERLNAFTTASYRTLAALLEAAASDPGTAVVVLKGSGRGFSSGVDLAVVSEESPGLAVAFAELVDTLTGFEKPLLAAVHGAAVGFGATILLHCDLVVMAQDARVRFPFSAIGTSPEAGSSLLLPGVVGWQKAAELLYTSRWLTGAEAAEAGLALRAVPAEALEAEVAELAGEIAALPPAAVGSAKRLMRTTRRELIRAAMAAEAEEARLLSTELGSIGGSR